MAEPIPRKLRARRVLVVTQDAEQSLEFVANELGDLNDTMMSIADLLYRMELKS